MAITIDQVDLMEIFKDIAKVCKSEASCGKCAEKACLVGYARDCVGRCKRNEITYVPNGAADVPKMDIRGGYDEYDALHAIAHLLVQCHSCKENHFENCIISVVRNCFEVIEFGEEQPFDGEVLKYLMELKDSHPEQASIIAEEYQNKKAELKDRESGGCQRQTL